MCCGTPFESKGLFVQADAKAGELEDALWQASEKGTWPGWFGDSARSRNPLPANTIAVFSLDSESSYVLRGAGCVFGVALDYLITLNHCLLHPIHDP
jgi:hypothetical protein